MRNQPIPAIAKLLLAAILVTTQGCNTPGRSSSYAVEKTVTLAEWQDWATQITNDIVEAPSFSRYSKGSPVMVAIGDFTNNSSRMDAGQDKDVFLSALQRTLTNTGKISVTRLYAGSGGRTDTVTRLSGELTQDPQFDRRSTDGLYGEAIAAELVLSLQFNQKRTVQGGRNTYENFFAVELIDARTKGVVYTALVTLPDKR